VFNKNQISYTSWFLDAFNYAILKKIDILNLSIGGHDFLDIAFRNKVLEVTSNNIIMVSGIGNDGPSYGTLNSPADQLDVIGVGGITSANKIAKFQSRGMTTWEIPSGYGRVKPDIVTFSTNIYASQRKTGCRSLSGTSVASPIIAGSIALLMSAAKVNNLTHLMNPSSMKQIIMASANRLDDANMFEQGFGKLNLIEAYNLLKKFKPQLSAIPSYIDFTECPYFWPYCTQPLYYSALPVIVNVTLLNSLSVSSVVVGVKWRPLEMNGKMLMVNFTYSSELWPWSGYLAVKLLVSKEAINFEEIVEGVIEVTVESFKTKVTTVEIYVKVKIIEKPARKRRLLWDQFHNLNYPLGYFPRDDLRNRDDPLDWRADHLHTNFKDLFQHLITSGYFVEVLGTSFHCFNAKNYGTLLLIDPEDEFHWSEIKKLEKDVKMNGLSVIVFADWYNVDVIKSAIFFDENSKEWWTPLTGGSNIPALNDLLQPFNISFTDKIYEGDFNIGQHSSYYASGTAIGDFSFSNKKNRLIFRRLNNQMDEFINKTNKNGKTKLTVETVPILGFVQTESKIDKSGRIAVYGDSSCLDSRNLQFKVKGKT
jgi:membrane-bound transcription factor site-1 protease